MASLRELFISIGLDADTRGFSRIEKGLKTVRKFAFAATAAIGGLSAAVFAVAKSTANYADTIDDTASAIGFTNKKLQTLGFAAKLSGSNLNEVSESMKRLARRANDAATNGTGMAADAFNALGISAAGANGKVKESDVLMQQIADKFATMPDGAEKTALAMDLFGRSGASMIPMLNEGSAGIAAMRQEAMDLGIVLNDDAIKAGSDFNDALDRLSAVFMGLKNSIGAAVIPALSQLVDQLREAISANIGWIRSGLSTSMNNLIAIVRGLGQFVMLLASNISWLTDKVGGLVPLLKVAGGLAAAFVAGRLVQALGNIASGAVIAARSFRVMNLSALGLPILIGAAVIAAMLIVDDLIAFIQGRPSVLGFLVKNKDGILATLSSVLDQVIGWINTALNTVLQLAEDGLTAIFEWAGVAPEKAREAAENIIGVFRFLKDAVAETISAMMEGFKILWPFVVDGAKTMLRGLVSIFEGIKTVFDTFIDGVKASIRGIANLVSGPLDTLKSIAQDIGMLLGIGNDEKKFTVKKEEMVSPARRAAVSSVGRMASGVRNAVDNRNQSNSVSMQPTINVSVQGGATGENTGQNVAEAVENAMSNVFRSVERSNKPAFAQ